MTDRRAAAGELYAALEALASGLARSSDLDAVQAVPPLGLEEKLNGGHNPLIGHYYGGLLVEDRALRADATVLDLGCGYGRIALDLASRLTPEQRYIGLDPNAEAVAWATENIASRRPNFSFERIDVHSTPYNPEGALDGAAFRFPLDDDSVDLVFMISVLTHVDLPTLQTYVRETARVLKPETGRFVATLFLLDPEVDALLAAGRSTFRMPWMHGESRVENRTNPELAISHPRERVLQIVRDAGFARTVVRQGSWSGRTDVGEMDYQDLLIADVRVPAATPSADRSIATRPEDPALRAVADRLADGGVTAEDLPAFLMWAVAASVNALWWESDGITISVRGAPLQLVRCRELGFDDLRAPDTAVGAFTSVAEGEILARVAAAGARPLVVGFIDEVVGNGLLLDAALRSGVPAVQRLPDGSERTAPVPLQR